MARINNQYHSPYEATIARYLPFIDSWLYPAEAAMRISNDEWYQEQRHFSSRNIELEKTDAQKETFFTKARDLLWKYNRSWLKNIAGGFTPVAYMWKDLKDTFKPYKADYQRNRDLISIGAYSKGTDPRIDLAINAEPAINAFLQQGMQQIIDFEHGTADMTTLCGGLGKE